MHKKPRGVNGSVFVGAGLSPEFQKLNFPDEKSEMESNVMRAALSISEKMQPSFYGLTGEVRLNSENDFDFSLPVKGGIEYIDLAEITIGMDKGGHENAPSSHVVGEFVDAAWKIVESKDRKYGGGRAINVHLLLFITDWKFSLSPSCIRLLSVYCKKRAHQFKSIAYFLPINPGGGIFTPIFPAGEDLNISLQEELRLRNLQLHQANPQNALTVDNGKSIIFRF